MVDKAKDKIKSFKPGINESDFIKKYLWFWQLKKDDGVI